MTTFLLIKIVGVSVSTLFNLMADIKSPFNQRLSLHHLSNPSDSFWTNHVVPPHRMISIEILNELFQITVFIPLCDIVLDNTFEKPLYNLSNLHKTVSKRLV